MITVIVPIFNEQENIESLFFEIVEAATKTPIKEIIYVDDGSTDHSLNILKNLKQKNSLLRIIKHSKKSGQSLAFWSGVSHASQPLIVLMDGDGQNDPKDIEKLYQQYAQVSSDEKKIMIAGQRAERKDNFVRKISSILANKIRSTITRDGIRDTGCSLKLIRKEDYLSLPYFDHMHRFLPALLIRNHVKILTTDVSHRPRKFGVSKYGFWQRLLVGITDLIGVRWLIARGIPQDFKNEDIK